MNNEHCKRDSVVVRSLSTADAPDRRVLLSRQDSSASGGRQVVTFRDDYLATSAPEEDDSSDATVAATPTLTPDQIELHRRAANRSSSSRRRRRQRMMLAHSQHLSDHRLDCDCDSGTASPKRPLEPTQSNPLTLSDRHRTLQRHRTIATMVGVGKCRSLPTHLSLGLLQC